MVDNEAFVFWILGRTLGRPVWSDFLDYEVAVVVDKFLRERGRVIGRNRPVLENKEKKKNTKNTSETL